MWETLHNNAGWDCFRTLTLPEILETQKSTSSGLLCIFGSHTFVPVSWMCKKQTSVSHSSTEAEMISLDAGLRMDGIPALDLWDLVIEVFHSSPKQILGNLLRDTPSNKHTQNKTKVPTLELCNIDCVCRTQIFLISVRCSTLLRTARLIKMIIKGRSPTMRHVSRTHRVALDWLFDRINVDPQIQIKYVDIKHISQTY